MAGVQDARQCVRSGPLPEGTVNPMDLLAVLPDPAPPALVRTLDLGGCRWTALASAEDAARHEPSEGWGGAVVACDADAEGAWALCRALRKRDTPVSPLMVLVSGS